MSNEFSKGLAGAMLATISAAAPIMAEIATSQCKDGEASGACPWPVAQVPDDHQREPPAALVERAQATVGAAAQMPFNNSNHFLPPQEYRDPSLYSWVQGPSRALLESASL